MQEIYTFIDDSGVLHKNADNKHFIYAGYIFLDKPSKESAKRKYKKLNREISRKIRRSDELKACNLSTSNKRALFNVMRKELSFHVCVEIDRVYSSILQDKKSIVRFKDYALKRLLKQVFVELINSEDINPHEDMRIFINIDQQLTSTDGYYGLRDSIIEEFRYGIINHNYGCLYQPIVFANLDVELKYCDSKHDYLIQASDILANRMFAMYRDNKKSLFPKNRHIQLLLP